jgi:hypothetical protein
MVTIWHNLEVRQLQNKSADPKNQNFKFKAQMQHLSVPGPNVVNVFVRKYG